MGMRNAIPDVRGVVGCTVFRQWAAVKAVPVADGRRCRDGFIEVVSARFLFLGG